MKRWQTTRALGDEVEVTAVAVGNFDGLHLGHQEIVRQLLAAGRRLKCPTVVVTFDPHPAVILGQALPPLLTTPAQRAELMEPLGIDHFVTLPFTPELAQMSARSFLEEILLKPLGMRVLCIGPTTHLGKAREGTPERLEELSIELGFELSVASELMLEGAIISSSRIREYLSKGDVETAAHLLGHPHFTVGRIVVGEGRGGSLGFPTANLAPVLTMLPARGVYATRVQWRGTTYPAATNIGTRPTLQGDATQQVVESHLLHFQENLLNEEVRIDWLHRLRDEKRFASPAELARQIEEDCRRVEREEQELK